VLDSDEELSSLSGAKKRKRKAGHANDGARHVLNLIDSDEDSEGKKASGKRPRTQMSGSRTSNHAMDSLSGPSTSSSNPGRLSDVIVLDD
jgi:hypothetical protein